MKIKHTIKQKSNASYIIKILEISSLKGRVEDNYINSD